MVFYPKVHQSKRVKGMRNLLGLLIAEDAQKMQTESKNAGCIDLGERENAGYALRILGKCECN